MQIALVQWKRGGVTKGERGDLEHREIDAEMDKIRKMVVLTYP